MLRLTLSYKSCLRSINLDVRSQLKIDSIYLPTLRNILRSKKYWISRAVRVSSYFRHFFKRPLVVDRDCVSCKNGMSFVMFVMCICHLFLPLHTTYGLCCTIPWFIFNSMYVTHTFQYVPNIIHTFTYCLLNIRGILDSSFFAV